MSRRPPVFVLALTIGDYLLWNWSLNGGHEVLALVSGLTLPPLALVSFWVLAMGAMRVLAGAARAMRGSRTSRAAAVRAASRPTRAPASGPPRTASERAPAPAATEGSRRIAA